MIQKIPDSDPEPASSRKRRRQASAEAGGDAPQEEESHPEEVVALGADERGVTAELPPAEIPEEPGDEVRAEDAEAGDPPVTGPTAERADGGAGEDDDAEGGDEASTPAAELGDVGAPDGPGSRAGLALTRRVEAVLFASSGPLAPRRLANVLEVELEAVKAALDALQAQWEAADTAMELVAIAGGYRFMTRPVHADDLAGLARKAKTEHLSPAALETLAVVAYRQPIGRADIEAIRGVAAGPLLRVLLDRDLIRIAGRSKEPGHPLLYGTTKRFLDHFGLKSLKQLPDLKDLLAVT